MSSEQQKARGRGKQAEYRLAKLVGGIVVGRSKAILFPSGQVVKINPCAPPDVVTPLFSFESKYLKNLPVCVNKAVIQARMNCPERLIPITVMCDRTSGKKLYIMEEKDFLDLHCGLPFTDKE